MKPPFVGNLIQIQNAFQMMLANIIYAELAMLLIISTFCPVQQ